MKFSRFPALRFRSASTKQYERVEPHPFGSSDCRDYGAAVEGRNKRKPPGCDTDLAGSLARVEPRLPNLPPDFVGAAVLANMVHAGAFVAGVPFRLGTAFIRTQECAGLAAGPEPIRLALPQFLRFC